MIFIDLNSQDIVVLVLVFGYIFKICTSIYEKLKSKREIKIMAYDVIMIFKETK